VIRAVPSYSRFLPEDARYLAVVRERGSAWDPSRPMRAQAGWLEHARFMNDLAASGFVVLGGPLADGEERFLIVVDAADPAAARSRLADDPWSASAMLRIATIEPWTILLDSRGQAQPR
jgi:uncharacterized protein YciI